MHTLDLYKNRKYSEVKIGKNIYKIPNEYTVDEVERMLELKAQQEEIKDEEVIGKTRNTQLKKFYDVIFYQLEVLLQHYHPELNEESLRKLMTHNEALEALGFFDEYRNLKGTKEKGNTDVKKKLK